MPQNNMLFDENFANHSRNVKLTLVENAEEPMDLTFSQTKIKTELENVYNVQVSKLFF